MKGGEEMWVDLARGLGQMLTRFHFEAAQHKIGNAKVRLFKDRALHVSC